MFAFRIIHLSALLVIAFLILPGFSGSDANADSISTDTTYSDSTRQGCHCFLARPKPRCSSFWIVESSLLFRQAEKNVREGKARFLMTGNLGYMVNLDTMNAIGGSLFASGDDDSGKFAVCFRYRRWIGRRMSLDVAPGIILSANDNYSDPKTPGFVMTVSLGMPNWFFCTVHYEVIKTSGDYWTSDRNLKYVENTQSSLYMGIKTSHWWALTWPVVMIILIGATWE